MSASYELSCTAAFLVSACWADAFHFNARIRHVWSELVLCIEAHKYLCELFGQPLPHQLILSDPVLLQSCCMCRLMSSPQAHSTGSTLLQDCSMCLLISAACWTPTWMLQCTCSVHMSRRSLPSRSPSPCLCLKWRLRHRRPRPQGQPGHPPLHPLRQAWPMSIPGIDHAP